MSVSVLINGYDLEQTFGVCLEDGGLSVFETPPIPKEPFFNEWQDQSGRDYDESAPVVYDSQLFEIPFLMVANSMSDYRRRKRDFLELITVNTEFDFQVLKWGEAFKMRFKGASNWDFITTNLDGETSARFVLRLENNFNKGYAFRYLADNLGRRIVINGSQEILVKTTY